MTVPSVDSLLTDRELESSEIVANSLMNRQRQLLGSNSYAKELGFSPLDFLVDRIQRQGTGSWLDLCCGTGRALVQAANHLSQLELASQAKIIGVDLVSQFHPYASELTCLNLITDSVHTYQASRQFDLITCVHGLHYVGDKLAVIQRAASWLTDDGFLIVQLDLSNLWIVRADTRKTISKKFLATAGFRYDSRTKLLSLKNRQEFMFPLLYLGADDGAGPNYTGQAAVNSFYQDQ